jgi:hypothetical protein
MTRLEALRGLYDAVKAGTFPHASIGIGGGRKRPTINGVDADFFDAARDAYKGSVDAALALIEATLPDWTVNSLHQNRYPDNGMKPDGTWTCLLFAATPRAFLHQEQKAANPAAALLLATLAALIAIEEGKG